MKKEIECALTLIDFANKEGFELLTLNKCYNSSLDLDTPIYRYIHLDRFLEMLQKKEFYICNRTSFTDKHEQGWKKDLKNMFGLLPVPTNLLMELQNQQTIAKQSKQKESAQHICISCWTLDQHENGDWHGDSFLMWQARGIKSIRMKSTVRKLLEQIDYRHGDNDIPIVVSKVIYSKEQTTSTPMQMLFEKTLEYQDEQEVRLCALVCEDYLSLPILSLAGFIDEITLSPFISPKTNIFIKDSVINKYPELSGKVTDTQMIETPQY